MPNSVGNSPSLAIKKSVRGREIDRSRAARLDEVGPPSACLPEHARVFLEISGGANLIVISCASSAGRCKSFSTNL